MLLRKSTGGRNADKIVDVVVEPAAGVPDEEVLSLLEKLGARNIERLYERFIHARGRLSLFAELGPKATVHELPEQQLRAE